MNHVGRVPHQVMQQKVFNLLGSQELFLLRGVCCEWSD